MPPKPNVPLLLAVYAHLQAFPEKWAQGRWMGAAAPDDNPCGTAMCFAGWAVTLADRHRPITLADEAQVVRCADEWVWNPAAVDLDESERWNGKAPIRGADQYIEARAARVLGLMEEEAWLLFAGDNTMRRIERAIERILERAK